MPVYHVLKIRDKNLEAKLPLFRLRRSYEQITYSTSSQRSEVLNIRIYDNFVTLHCTYSWPFSSFIHSSRSLHNLEVWVLELIPSSAMQTKILPRTEGDEFIKIGSVFYWFVVRCSVALFWAYAGFDGMTLARSEREWAILVSEVSWYSPTQKSADFELLIGTVVSIKNSSIN